MISPKSDALLKDQSYEREILTRTRRESSPPPKMLHSHREALAGGKKPKTKQGERNLIRSFAKGRAPGKICKKECR